MVTRVPDIRYTIGIRYTIDGAGASPWDDEGRRLRGSRRPSSSIRRYGQLFGVPVPPPGAGSLTGGPLRCSVLWR